MELFRADNLFPADDRASQPFDVERTTAPGVARRSPAIAEPAPPAWERSTYLPSRRIQGPAALGSLAIVATLLGAFLLLNIAGGHRERHQHPMVTLDLTPPAPKPSRPQPQAQHQVEPKPEQPPIVAPPPKLSVTPAPPVVATAPEPPSPVVAPGPPAPRAAPGPAAAHAIAQGGDLSARMIFAKPPIYPLESRRRHEQGTVVLALMLSLDGLVSDISIARSSGSDRLDQAALAAVRKWRWAPTIRDGQPVLVKGDVSIPFVLTH
jgi:protein TonB